MAGDNGLARVVVTWTTIVMLAGLTFATAPSEAKGRYSDRQLERSLRAQLKKKEGLHPTRISRCGPRRNARVYVCRWKAAGLFPGEVPYRCSGKARFLTDKKRWRVDKCANELEEMVPLLPSPGPHPAFGFNEEWVAEPQHNPRINLLPAVGADVARLAVRWDNVNSVPGTFVWQSYDQTYSQLVERGIRPLIVIISAPCWAQSGDCVPLGHPSPDHYDDLATFAALTAQRYGEAIGIEIWNEPNLAAFWGGEPDPAAYGEILKHVVPAVHEANPSMPAITAGLVPTGQGDEAAYPPVDFLRRAYATGGPQLADAIGAHPYPFRPYGGDFLGAIRIELFRYLRVMANFDDEAKPIWVTEVGVANDEGYDLAQQADALSRIYVMFRRIANIPVVIFHRFVDRGDSADAERSYGVVAADGNPKPAYCAVAAARGAPC